MIHYLADLVDGDMPIVETMERFHRTAGRVLGAGYDFTFERFPHKAHTWQLYAELDKPERRGELPFVSFNELAWLEAPAATLPIELLALEKHAHKAFADMCNLGAGIMLGDRHVPHEELFLPPERKTAPDDPAPLLGGCDP